MNVGTDSHFAITSSNLTSKLNRNDSIWIGSAKNGMEFKVHSSLPFSGVRLPLEPKWAKDPIEEAPIYLIPPPRTGWAQQKKIIDESNFMNTIKSIKVFGQYFLVIVINYFQLLICIFTFQNK